MKKFWLCLTLLSLSLIGCGPADSVTAPPRMSGIAACRQTSPMPASEGYSEGWLGPVDGTSGGYWRFWVPFISSATTNISAVYATYYPNGPLQPPYDSCINWPPPAWRVNNTDTLYTKNFIGFANETVGDNTWLWIKDTDVYTNTDECWSIFSDYYTTGQNWFKVGCGWGPL